MAVDIERTFRVDMRNPHADHAMPEVSKPTSEGLPPVTESEKDAQRGFKALQGTHQEMLAFVAIKKSRLNY